MNINFRKLSHSEIRDFNRGRMLFKDGDSGEKFLIQSPFFNVENDKHSYFMFKLLGIKEDKIKQKIERLKYINILNKELQEDKITEEQFLELIKNYDKKNEIEEKKEEKIEENEEIKFDEEIEEENEEEKFDDEENIIKELYEEVKNLEKEKKEFKKEKMDSCYLIKTHLINRKKFKESKERLLKLKEFYQQF
jgi:hypothetical protein